MISRILNVVNVVRHYLMMERYSLDTNLRDMRPRFVQDIVSMTSERWSLSHTILLGRYDPSVVRPSLAT